MQSLLEDVIRDPSFEGVYADYLEDCSQEESSRLWRSDVTELNSLTHYQESLLAVWKDLWLSVGLTADPTIDKTKVELLMREVYAEASLPSPNIYVFLDSPLQGCIGAWMLTQSSRHKGQVRDQVWDQVGDQVGSQVRGQVRDQVGDQVRDQVWDQVRDQVWDQVWDQVGDQVGSQVGSQVYKCCYGAHDSHWLSFYSYLYHAGRIKACKRLLPLIKLAHEIGWWWPFKNAVVITPRPSKLVMKGNKLAKIQYPDGWGFFGNKEYRQ